MSLILTSVQLCSSIDYKSTACQIVKLNLNSCRFLFEYTRSTFLGGGWKINIGPTYQLIHLFHFWCCSPYTICFCQSSNMLWSPAGIFHFLHHHHSLNFSYHSWQLANFKFQFTWLSNILSFWPLGAVWDICSIVQIIVCF